MRELDQRTIRERGEPAETLMDRAGLGVADHVSRLRSAASCAGEPVTLVAGRGNNGGDAFAAARHLAAWNVPVRVLLAGRANAVSETAAVHLRMLRQAGVPVEERPEPSDWQVESCRPAVRRGVVVDGLLGTGSAGAPRGVVREAISWIRAAAGSNRVVSIDIPSGMDADTGEGEHVVRADLTVTLGLPKCGLLMPSALECVGQLRVVDIGIPREWTESMECDTELIAGSEVAGLLRRRARDSHKGAYGTLLVVAGARGYAGAAALAARAALLAGAGLVHVAAPRCVADTVAAMVPEVMVHPVADTAEGAIAETAWHDIAETASRATAILIGPGLTPRESGRFVLARVLAQPLPVVLDADALNLLAAFPSVLGRRSAATVLTPHPGEMARLIQTTTQAVQSERITVARTASDRWHSIVVLKGAGTVVHGGSGPAYVNLTGNPGMATAGAGDVLAGMLGGLLAGRMDALGASKLAVYLHGIAGDIAAIASSETSLTSLDIARAVPLAVAELTFR
jgi:NAD(P)H-hydrate epimerase